NALPMAADREISVAKKQIQVGVHQGDGPPPGYQWGVVLLSFVRGESRFLSEHQRRHLADQVKELAREADPTHCDTVCIRPIEEYHELKDWGGILGDLN